MATAIRLLIPGDEAALESFLEARPATSMFLRSNLRAGGIDDHGDRYQGTYAAAFDGDAVTGVVSHAWQGNLVLQLPRCEREVIELAIRSSGRPLAGLVGPWEQVEAARHSLGLVDTPTVMDSCEDLFSLSLDDLVVPSGFADGSLVCRAPREDEFPRLSQWNFDYAVEALRFPPDDELRKTARRTVELQAKNGTLYVLLDQGVPVSQSGFNATLPDCVQIGGVFTPPEFRSRGYGRAAVAGSLINVADRGVHSSILFTDKANGAARRAYQALGYQLSGEYGLIRFEDPVRFGGWTSNPRSCRLRSDSRR